MILPVVCPEVVIIVLSGVSLNQLYIISHAVLNMASWANIQKTCSGTCC